MDLNTVTEVDRPASREEIRPWRDGDAWLAGGTWLFSEPQPGLRRLVDLEGLRWEPLRVSDQGLAIAATCTIRQLDAFIAPPDWQAAPLIRQCCRSLLASFKIWNTATVGGNLCMSLPAGALIPLTAALEGVCTLWPRDGGERRCARESDPKGRRRASAVRLVGRFRRLQGGGEAGRVSAGTIGRRSVDRPGRKIVAYGPTRG
jgi:CO/xanthine dehydrogenase FAD-binding subunit